MCVLWPMVGRFQRMGIECLQVFKKLKAPALVRPLAHLTEFLTRPSRHTSLLDCVQWCGHQWTCAALPLYPMPPPNRPAPPPPKQKPGKVEVFRALYPYEAQNEVSDELVPLLFSLSFSFVGVP